MAETAGNKDRELGREEWNQVWGQWVRQSSLNAVAIRGNGRDWSQPKYWPRVSAPLVYRGVLYTVAFGAICSSLDPVGGTLHKTGRLAGALGNYFASPVAADGKIYAISEEGRMVVLRAGKEWEILAANDLGEAVYATPALSRGVIYVRTGESLFAFGVAK